MAKATETDACAKLKGVNVHATDGMVMLVDPTNPENRFIFTREQSTLLGNLLEGEAPQLALMLRAAARSSRDLAASSRRGSYLDDGG